MSQKTIDVGKIHDTHVKIKKIVEAHKDINWEVSQITQKLKENWVGKGRNEFESQYNILIRKIEDFGDTLMEMYDALVEAEAEYETVDNEIRQKFTMSMQK